MFKKSLFPVNVRALKHFQANKLIFPPAAKTVNAFQIFACAQALIKLECATLPLLSLLSMPDRSSPTKFPLIVPQQNMQDHIASL
jgi:hypothetical protein